jgi:hypothetical protein
MLQVQPCTISAEAVITIQDAAALLVPAVILTACIKYAQIN